MYEHPSFQAARDHYWKEWSVPIDWDNYLELPLVELWRSAGPGAQRAPCKIFDGQHVLFIQHHLGPFIGRLRAMFEDGLDPRNCWFVDIPYSTSPLVWEQIRKLGCPEKQAASPFNDPYALYSEVQLQRVSEIVSRIAEQSPESLLVVDDGAYFLRALERLRNGDRDLSERFGPESSNTSVCIVEQTTRGHRHLGDPTIAELVEEIEAPIVSIARSFTKTKLEGPFVGEAVAKGVQRAVKESTEHASFGATAVLGLGVVGRATLKALQRLERTPWIEVVDHDPSTRQLTEEHGAKWRSRLPSTRNESSVYDLVIGCTGFGSFGISHRSLLRDGALLISGSSAAVEFNRANFIEKARQQDFQSLKIVGPEPTAEMANQRVVNCSIHTDLTLQSSDLDRSAGRDFNFTFANAGFPVNFTGEIECLPIPLIQPTHALLYAACVQTIQLLNNGKSGMCPLNEDDDIWIFIEGVKEIDNRKYWEGL